MMKDVSEKHRPFFATQHYYNRLRIVNLTGMPSPVVLLVTYADQTTENIKSLLTFGGKTVTPFEKSVDPFTTSYPSGAGSNARNS